MGVDLGTQEFQFGKRLGGFFLLQLAYDLFLVDDHAINKAEDKKDDGRRKNKAVGRYVYFRIPGQQIPLQPEGANDQYDAGQQIKPPLTPVEKRRIDKISMDIE